jgi:RNA polymerase sigma factor (sigma-70 family)
MPFNSRNVLRRSDKLSNEELITFLYHNYVNDLFKWGRTFTSDRELIKDCIQNLFVYLLKNKHALNKIHNQKVYLFQALRNNLLTRLKERSMTIRKDCENDREINSERDDSPTIQELYDNKAFRLSRRKLLQRLFGYLTKKQRQIIQLRFYQGMEYEEICEILEINYQSVRTLTYRAIVKMREAHYESKKIQ